MGRRKHIRLNLSSALYEVLRKHYLESSNSQSSTSNLNIMTQNYIRHNNNREIKANTPNAQPTTQQSTVTHQASLTATPEAKSHSDSGDSDDSEGDGEADPQVCSQPIFVVLPVYLIPVYSSPPYIPNSPTFENDPRPPAKGQSGGWKKVLQWFHNAMTILGHLTTIEKGTQVFVKIFNSLKTVLIDLIGPYLM